MKALNQANMLWRLGAVTFSWILIQLLMLPNVLQQTTQVVAYSGYALIALIVVITGVDGYRVQHKQLCASFIGIDLVTLITVGGLLWFTSF